MNYLQPYILAFSKHLQKTEDYTGQPQNLYLPVDYILSLGGKRLRPVLVLMAHHLFDNEFEKSLSAATALEVFHNFTLVHDDIMDNADIRRGSPTVHKKYSVNQAILSGDVMLISSYHHLLSYQPSQLSVRLIEIMTKMAQALCEGQQLDMDFECRDDIAIGDYLEMIEKKTAVLLGAAMQMGALIGGADEEDAAHLYEFGKNFGIAFQLQDDVLDTFGTEEAVGKLIGGDIVRNKKTYLYLKALELADDQQKKKLLNYYAEDSTHHTTEKVDWVTDTFRKLGVKEYATLVMEAYRDLAISHLQQCKADNQKRAIFTQLVEDYLYRNH